MTDTESKVFRFKFSKNFTSVIEEFTRIHKFDHPKDFKEAWLEWKDENKKIINQELRFLSQKGYDKNIEEKIYKSIRYYHKNKNSQKTKAQKRKPYVSLSKTILEAMDSQIDNILSQSQSKPSVGFTDFMTNIDKSILDKQVAYLKMNGYLKPEDVLNKFKKTYKNRYFIKQKKN